MGNIGMPELLVILVIIIVLFGAKKIPDIAKGLGLGIKEFKKAAKDVETEAKKTDSPSDSVKSNATSDKDKSAA